MARPTVDVSRFLREFREGLNEQQKKLVPKASKIALGRVGVTVRKQASLSIRQKLAIKAALAKKAISIRKKDGGLVLVLEATGRPIPLKDFGARETRAGVSYMVSKAKGRQLYRNKYGPGFLVQRFGGRVFARTEAEGPGRRARIRQVYGPSVPQYFVTRVVRDLMLNTARERWPIEFAAAFRGLQSRAGS